MPVSTDVPPPDPPPAPLLRTTAVLLLVLGAVSLLVGLLSVLDTGGPVGMPLLFLGGGVLFALLGSALMIGIRRIALQTPAAPPEADEP